MVAQTRKGGGGNDNSPRKLKFSDKIVSKQASTDLIIKRLKKLHIELAELEQDNVDLTSVKPYAKELINRSILLHKDKGIKAYAACCLADMLRLFAPDAPYTGPELRDIFQFFFRQLSLGLKGSDSPYYNEYFHLLESLSTVKSVVLICDLPQAEELMTQVFRDIFGLVRQDLAKNVEMFMSDILVALIDECQVLPTEVLEIILAQFMDKNTRIDQPAYRLAVEVCNQTSDKLQRNVCQYFTDNIVQHAQAEEYDEVARCHELIKRINVNCPALLHNVVPQLEEELRVEEVELRTLATQALGEMFADKQGDFQKKYPSTWALWLARRNDKSTQVRLAFVEGCKGLLLHHLSEVREAIEEALQLKLLDPDEKVRAAVCKLFGQLDYETALHYVSEKQLRSVGERALDKKHSVRREALMGIGRLFSIAYSEIENNDSTAVKQFSWIPQQILQSITLSPDLKATVLQVIAEFILPVPSKGDDEVQWTDRLLTVISYLDEKHVNVLIMLSNLKLIHPSIFEKYIDCCVLHNGGIIDSREDEVKKMLSQVIRMVSTLIPEPTKTTEDLQEFANMNEQRLYKLIKTCMDPKIGLKDLVKASSEFTRRVEQSNPSILPTMMSFFRLSSLWIVNQSSIPTILKRIQKQDFLSKDKNVERAQKIADSARVLLTTISKSCPAVLRSHVSELLKVIAEEKDPGLELCLQALAAVSKQEPSLTPSDKKTTERLVRYVRGSQPRHTKFATRVLLNSKNKQDFCTETIEFIANDLSKADPESLVSRIAALVEFVRFTPEAFEEKSDVLIEFLLKETLLQVSSDESMEEDEDANEWVNYDDLPALAKAKILALKVCKYRCLVHATSENAVEIATPVLKMFTTLLENGGSFSDKNVDDLTVKSRLRLQAASSLLQLATIEKFSEVVTSCFVRLALIIQDPCFEVRQLFLNKLTALITSRKLPARFNVILFLTVHDPEDEIRDKARSIVVHQLKRSTTDIKLVYWELIFIRLLHLLAHHPDAGLEEYPILDLAKYIRFYLSLVANSDNISLLLHLAQKCKTIRDAESHFYSEQLYAISELAQELIRLHAKARQWSLLSYPGKVKLPGDIFRPLPSDATRSTILKKAYLPEHLLKLLDEPTATASKERKPAAKRKAPGQTNGEPKRTRGPNKKRKRRRVDDDDDDDVDDDDGEDSDDRIETDDDIKGASSPNRTAPIESDSDEGIEEGSNDETNEDLGRGARTRAKTKAQQRAKRKAKNKAPASDS